MMGDLAREWWEQARQAVRVLPWALRLLWESHRLATVAVCFFTLIQASLAVAQLWVTKLLVDAVVVALTVPVAERAGAVTQGVLFYVGLEVAVLLAGVLIGLGFAHSRNILQEHLVYNVQLKVLTQAARLDLAAYESPVYHDQLHRAQQEGLYGPVQLLTSVLTLAQAVVTLISVGGLILLHQLWVLPVLLLTTIPSFAAMLYYGQKRFIVHNTRTPDGRRAEYLSQILASDSYAKELRVWGLTGYLIEQVQALRRRFRQENIALSAGQARASLGGELLSTLGYYAAYVSVVMAVLAGRLTLGDLSLYAGAFSRTQSLFEEILRAVAEMYEIQLFVDNLVSFLALEPTVVAPAQPQPAPPLQQQLEIRNLSFVYPGTEEVVLHDLNFTIRAGECVALVGANGAGKTTLVKCLLRLYDPSGGAILADGVDLRELEPVDWRGRIGVVFQDYARYQLTARENVGFGHLPDLHALPAIRAATEQVGMDGVLAKLPEGYETLLGRHFEGGHELSLGQWQRVAVARALLRDAPLLVLDEPTAALDAQAEYDLYQHFTTLVRGRMTLLISHRFSTVRMADRILVLDEGQIIEEGNHEDLMARNGHYAHLFKIQAESYQLPQSDTEADAAADWQPLPVERVQSPPA